MEQHWEESEKVLSWREMQPGVYMYRGIEQRGMNDYDKPISVVTLEKDGITKMYYAPPSLYWSLKNRPVTNFIKYDPVADTPSAETTKNVLTTTQWLSIISIVVSVTGLYYKREEIKNLLVKKADPPPRAPPPSPVLTRAPPVIREMD